MNSSGSYGDHESKDRCVNIILHFNFCQDLLGVTPDPSSPRSSCANFEFLSKVMYLCV